MIFIHNSIENIIFSLAENSLHIPYFDVSFCVARVNFLICRLLVEFLTALNGKIYQQILIGLMPLILKIQKTFVTQSYFHSWILIIPFIKTKIE